MEELTIDRANNIPSTQAELFDTKVKRAFGAFLVRKELVQAHEMARLPRFISEYLIAKFYLGETPTQE